MITEMMRTLQKEASEEANQKAYCDKELKDTAEKLEEKTTEVRSLKTKIAQRKSASSKLKEQVATLQSEIAAMTKSFAEATKLRQEEKAAFTKNKAEMDQGLKGVQMASSIIREYYAGADSKKDDTSAEMGNGVLGMLEVIESDVTKGIAELVAAEETAASDYKKLTQANRLESVTKDKDIKYKTKEFKGLDKAVTELSSDLSGVQDESDAVKEYDAKIKKTCATKTDPYEERKARREAEIAGLKDALEQLAQQTSLLQKSSKRTLRGAGKTIAP